MVLSTYMDAQEHLPYADDSTAATPMSEENGAIILPFCNGLHQTQTIPSFGKERTKTSVYFYTKFQPRNLFRLMQGCNVYVAAMGSRHSSYNSHASRLSYTSHDLLTGGRHGGFGQAITKESQLIQRAKTLYGDPDKGYKQFDGVSKIK